MSAVRLLGSANGPSLRYAPDARKLVTARKYSGTATITNQTPAPRPPTTLGRRWETDLRDRLRSGSVGPLDVLGGAGGRSVEGVVAVTVPPADWPSADIR
ncbi:hypothetical protein GCM10009610_24460 [Pseudonocardia xinjiangensis]